MTVSIQSSLPAAGYAQQELRHFIGKYSGARLAETEADLNFRLELDPALEAHCYCWEKKPELAILKGGSPSALLCCVYELLSAMGICFTTEGDSLCRPFDFKAIPESQSFSPYCRNRGIRQHINFPMDISSYSLKEAKSYIRNLARMQMNAITFHSYNGQWHPFVKNGQRMPAGHFFYGQRHPLPRDPEIAGAIENRRAFCIPEAEAVLDEAEKREQYAVYWLNEVIATAKEAEMRVTLSVECQESTALALEKDMAREVLRLYPKIDMIELVTPEGGGDDSKSITGEEALVLGERLFGKSVTAATLEALTKNGRLPFEGTPSYALDGTLRSIKQIWRMWQDRGEWLTPGKELQVGLYVTCKETLRVAKEVMNRIFPAELSYSFLPSHGSLAVAEAVEHMEFSNAELQRTMLYSWAEFDGNMYIQQNSCSGIQKLLELCRSTSPSIHGICLNHWRTAENSLTISYAAKASRSFAGTKDYYRQYAEQQGIADAEAFTQQLAVLEELDVFNRDNLFNIGFCYLGCWLNPKGLGWIRGWKAASIAHSISVYESLAEKLDACLQQTNRIEGIGRLRLLINRCHCSGIHLKAIAELTKISAFVSDGTPGALSAAEKEEVRQHCSRALEYAKAYQRLHIQEMPDRGCEGTLVSYCETIPVYIDHILQYFAEGETNCTHCPPSLDEPPPPDTSFFR